MELQPRVEGSQDGRQTMGCESLDGFPCLPDQGQPTVPNEQTVVETIEALEDQYGDEHFAVGHRQRNISRAMVDPSRSWQLPNDS